jgi:beta-lactamase class A
LQFLFLALAALLLAACATTEAEPPISRSAPTSRSVPTSTPTRQPPDPTPTATRIVSTPPPAFTPQPSPTATPRPITTPQGTTGLQEGDGGDIRHDEDCLAGDTSALPLPSPPKQQSASEIALPEPYEPNPYLPDDTLQTSLDEAVGEKSDSYAFFVKDLATGRGASQNGERVFNAASLFKLFVMYGVFRQEHLGRIDWGDELVVTPYYDAFALSPRATELCQVLTVAEAMDAMLSVSDNAAAVLLQDLAAAPKINTAIQALGLKDSGLFEDGLPVTANDLALLMEAIAVGEAISPAASADMVRLLDHDVFENGLVQGVPAGTRVARKTGNWSDATHVAGIVFAPWGPYVFVALTSNGYETSVIEALSRAAYEYFSALHGR